MRLLAFKAMLLSALLLSALWAGAQSSTISGTITSEDGTPLEGVLITNVKSKQKTLSTAAGKFTIAGTNADVFECSYVGYTTSTFTGEEAKNSAVKMKASNVKLDEVVVTAMGIKKEKKALGYSVQEIKSDELMKNKDANVINSLNGKIAGVNITQSGGAPGAGSNIILRGGTSLQRDNQPVFVIDGIIYDNGTNVGGNSGFDGAQRTATTYGNRVMDVNPEDVESISVLKGPAAAALYGSRAAAGVIVITTKKGQEGSAQVNVSSKYMNNWVNRYPEQQDMYKRGTYNAAGVFSDYTTQSWGNKFGANDTMYNNIKDFFRHGNIWDNSVSVSGGSKNTVYFLSANDFRQSGIIPGTDYNKDAFRFNAEQKYGRLSIGANVAYTYSKTNKTLTSAGLYNSGGTGALVSLYTASRSDDLSHYLNPDGSRYRMFAGLQQPQDDIDNPYWIINKDQLYDQNNRFTGGLNFNFKVADWFNIIYKAGLDRYTTTSHTLIYPGSGVVLQYQNGMMSQADFTYRYLSSNLMLNFQKRIKDFDLNLLLGTMSEDTKTQENDRLGYNFIIPKFFSFGNIAAANKLSRQVNTQKRLMGVYGEFRASYKNMLYLTVTDRNDWTSTLPLNSRSYQYPSVSGSFVFTEVIPKNNILSFGKVRASWAKVGKDADPYVTNTYLWDPRNYLGGIGTTNSWTRGNPFLVPEMTKSTELGMELRFFNGRLGVDYTYYTNNSFNQLLQPRLSQTTGYIFMTLNAGDIKNKGMELSVTGVPVKTKNFTWNSTINVSGNRGRVDNLITGVNVLYVTDVQVGNAKAASFNGGNFMGISGSRWTRDATTGKVVLDWNTGMPTYDGVTTYSIGNREPKFFGGFNNSLQYKNWNLSFLFDYRVGGDIYNGTDYAMTIAGMSPRSMNRDKITISGVAKNPSTTKLEDKSYTFEASKFYDRATSAEVPAGTANSQSGKYIIQQYYQTYYSYESANYMTNTNWLRLRSLSVSYEVPKTFLKTKTHDIIKALRATLTGTNLLLWTNYKGMDPETSAAGSGVSGSSSVGIDYAGVPATAGVSVGLNVTF